MSIIVSNKILIENVNQSVLDWCKDNLEFTNPEFAKKQNMGLWTGNIEPKIVLWEKKGNSVLLPYGCLESLFLSPRQPEHYIEYKSTIQPYEYQRKCINACFGKTGVIVMPCGSGKTQTALELVARYGARTLWITHTQELLNQSKERAAACFDIDEKTMGTITGGKINVGESITFATVQTMSKIDLTPYTDYWDVIIVDECHKAVGTPTKLMMFYKVVSQLNASIKVGLTATPKRNDGLEMCMYYLLGRKLYEVQEEEVKANTVPINVYMVESEEYRLDSSAVTNPDGTLNYTSLIQSVCDCTPRNEYIARIVNWYNNQGKTCLVLSDRVEHLKELRRLIGENYTKQIFAKVGSKAARQERKECLSLLKDKKIRCLFATYQLAKEGLDIPSLDCVLFATPKKDQITVIQSAGRVGRKALGKSVGIVLDIVDVNFSVFKNYAKLRKNMYKKKKFKIF